MALQSVEFIWKAANYVVDMFLVLLDATGMRPVYLASFGIFFAVAYLLGDIVVNAGSSDKARRKDDE